MDIKSFFSTIYNFDEDYFSLFSLVGLILCFVIFLIISNLVMYFPRKIAEKRLAKHGGFKLVFQELLALMETEYPDGKKNYDTLDAKIGRIRVSFLFDTLSISWYDQKWKYNVNDIKCDICKHPESKQKVSVFGDQKYVRDYRKTQQCIWNEILYDFMLTQSLSFSKNEDGSKKRTLTIDRVLSYKLEDLIYGIFQDTYYYTEKNGYCYDGYVIGWYTRDEILQKIVSLRNIDLVEADALLQELEHRNFIIGRPNKYWMSDFFRHYWNIITEEDNNINKWSRSHNVPKRSYGEVKELCKANKQNIQVSEPVQDTKIEKVEEIVEPHSPLYTIYRVGPEILTYQYPVDEKPYKEIYEEDGIIGPSEYSQYPDALEALRNNENDWFIYEEERKPIRDLVIRDLLTLAKSHNMAGAYSAIGSLCDNQTDMMKYWKMGIAEGNKESMVAYGIMLYCEGRTTDGFLMVKQGADAGDRTGCLLIAVSYNYGTLSEIDLCKAAEYYLKSLGKENDFYAYLNLGSLLIESGYYHTALRYYEKMREEYRKAPKEIREFGNSEKYLSNIETCKDLLKFPYQERIKRMVLQEHSRKLDSIFCKGHKEIAPIVPEHVSGGYAMWEPSPDQIDIDPLDLEERSCLPATDSSRPVDEKEDYLFLTFPVRIDNPEIYGTQSELIFLEKECHAELNKYIQENLISLRSSLKSLGYILTYLPAHTHDLIDKTDKLGSYHNDYGDAVWKNLQILQTEKTETEYWESLVSSSKLPEDCAGFLRYVPDLENLQDHTNYEYILFPYRPGTDWPRAFRAFIDLMRGNPIIPINDVREVNNFLPSGSILDITPDYDFVLRDNSDEVLASVSMPTLSKVVYLGLLNHPEGIIIKSLIDYKDELWGYYRDMAGDKARPENIDMLCDPTNNSINEKISRIKSAFTKALQDKYVEELPSFVPTGKRGEAYSVSVDRARIRNRGKKMTE